VAERTKAENENCRRFRTTFVRSSADQERGAPEYDARLAKVNEMRDEIARIGVEHHDLSSAFYATLLEALIHRRAAHGLSGR
jgi:hypothetical protein